MTLYLPGLPPQEPEVLPVCPPQQARRPRPTHRDDSLASLPAARATLTRLGVTHADWPHQRLLVVQVALRSYRLAPHRHEPAMHEVVREVALGMIGVSPNDARVNAALWGTAKDRAGMLAWVSRFATAQVSAEEMRALFEG